MIVELSEKTFARMMAAVRAIETMEVVDATGAQAGKSDLIRGGANGSTKLKIVHPASGSGLPAGFGPESGFVICVDGAPADRSFITDNPDP